MSRNFVSNPFLLISVALVGKKIEKNITNFGFQMCISPFCISEKLRRKENFKR